MVDRAGEELSANAWLCGDPRPGQVAAALWTGSVGLLILGLQPVLLGALFADNRMTFDELALAATIEMVAIAAGSAVMALALAPDRLRPKAATLLLVLALLCHLTATATSPHLVIGLRGLAGLAEGGLVAIATELVARSTRPERLGGIFLTLQTGAQCILAAVLALAVIPASGSAGGFEALALLTVASLAAVPFLPRRYEAIPDTLQVSAGIGGPMAMLSLAVIFTFYLFIGALWAFLEPLGQASALTAQTVGLITAVALAVQVAGAFTATLVERRLDYRLAIALSIAGALLAACVFAAVPGAALFWFAALLTGYVWLFVVPYQIRMTIVADPSRRTALLVPAGQLLGAAIGPVGATLLISARGVGAVPQFGIGCLFASLVLLAAFCILDARGRVSRAPAVRESKGSA